MGVGLAPLSLYLFKATIPYLDLRLLCGVEVSLAPAITHKKTVRLNTLKSTWDKLMSNSS